MAAGCKIDIENYRGPYVGTIEFGSPLTRRRVINAKTPGEMLDQIAAAFEDLTGVSCAPAPAPAPGRQEGKTSAGVTRVAVHKGKGKYIVIEGVMLTSVPVDEDTARAMTTEAAPAAA